MVLKNLECLRVKRYFFNYYLRRALLLKESFTNSSNSIDVLMQVSMEEFPIAIYLYNYFFKRRPQKFIQKEKYGQKQEKLPLKLTFKGKQFFMFMFFFRYWFSLLSIKNRQLYFYKVYEHKVFCQFMELSILFKNVKFKQTIDLYGLLADLNIDIYVNNNVNKKFSSYYSFFRYSLN